MGVHLTSKSTPSIQGAPLDAVSEVKAKDAPKETPGLRAPDAPGVSHTASSATQSSPAGLIGRFKPAVAGAMIALTLGTGCAMAGPPVGEYVTDTTAPTAIEYVVQAENGGGQAAFNRDMTRLEEMYGKGEISADQMARARGVLYRAHVLGFTESAPKDERGRITVESVLRGDAAGQQVRSKGEIVMDQFSRDLERRMRISARDMARGDYTAIEGLPGYKEIDASQVQRLFRKAMERMPIGELPFGEELVGLLGNLPGTEGLDIASLSYKDLSRELRDNAKEAFEARYGEFIDEHKIELGVTTFAAVTGLRAASPEAAKLMDQLHIRIRAWKVESDDGRLSTTGRLSYRDAHILPDLDLQARAHTPFGDHTTLRASIDATLSLEGDEHYTATATLGAHYTNDPYWADAAARYELGTDTLRTSLKAGYADPDSSLRWSGGLDTTFGDGVALGDASGRGTLHLDLGQDLDFGGGVKGYWGAYAGASADTDLSNDAVEGGIVFRLEW